MPYNEAMITVLAVTGRLVAASLPLQAKVRKSGALFGAVLLAAGASAFMGCAINYYCTPGVYDITPDRISPIEPVGTFEVSASQDPDPDRQYVFYNEGFSVWHTDRAMIAGNLAAQLAGEIAARGGRVISPADHSITISVPRAHAAPATWVMVGELTVEVSLDHGPARVFAIQNSSAGNIWRTMNGTIAVAVIEILNDAEVRKWLAATKRTR